MCIGTCILAADLLADIHKLHTYRSKFLINKESEQYQLAGKSALNLQVGFLPPSVMGNTRGA